MRNARVNVVLLLLGGVLALGLLALAWTLGAGSSEAQQGAMQNCPQAGKWAISVWSGDDATDTGDALATCGAGAVDAAYYLDPQTQGWLRWFAGRPEVSNLDTLNDMQGVIALGSAGAPPPTATPTPTPIVFQKGDEDLTFHLDTASFKLEWTVTRPGLAVAWIELTVFRQDNGSETVVCTAMSGTAPSSGSKDCGGGPGDFRLDVDATGDADWTVRITPQ